MVISVDTWEQAAARWRERTAEREKGYSAAKESTRPRLRVRRLTQSAAQDKAKALALAARQKGMERGSSLGEFALERIVGKSDLLDANFLELAIAMARPVARVRVSDGFGTGFLVSPSLLITNHHVIGDAGEGASATAEFDYQENRSGDLLPVQTFRLLPGEFFLSNEALDFTLIALAPKSDHGVPLSQYGWVKLIAEQGKADTGDCINIIQHPRGGLKQIALRENEVVDIFSDFVHYLTDTEPGSSGSPCFNDQWELVALHHSGVPKTDSAGRMIRDDGTVWKKGIDSPAKLAWVANEGVRVSSIVKAVEEARLGAAQEQLADQMLSVTPPNPIELARGLTPQTGDGAMSNSGSTSWVIPIQVTISLGAAAPSGTQVAAAPQAASAAVVTSRPAALSAAAAAGAGASTTVTAAQQEERIAIDRNYSNRTGYAADFITGYRIELPRMTADMEKNAAISAQAAGEKRHRLDYTHFTVVMNKARRIAYFTAVNIDGNQQQAIGARENDTWAFDTRLEERFQIGGEAYVGNALDQGHLVRRLDPVWGADKTVAKKGNDDTFHYTNCSPQHKTFNRGGELWQGLENYLLNRAQSTHKRLTVFTGPVLRPSDPVFQSEKMRQPIRIPLEFWKVAAMLKEDGTKAAAAFLVSQADLIGDATDLKERFEPKTFQVKISDIERLTGLKFAELRAHDTLGAGDGLEKFEAIDAGVRSLSTLDDIRL